jgi:hypothetical protein
MAEKAKNENISAAVPGSQTPIINDCTSSPNLFNPNVALSAVNTFMALNKVANQMFGLDARWFRAVPQQRGQDIMFKEYTLSNVEETPLCIKVLLADGSFPDNKYNYDLMGLEYEIPLTIHIDKKYWEGESGFGTAPQKKDIVYLTMPNKLYQVESSFLDRAFMQQETTWVINLRKYQYEASRRESDDLKETIEQYTVSEEEIFGDLQDLEAEKITNPQQFSQFNSTSRDQYKILDDALEVISQNIEFYGVVVAESFYDLSTSELPTAVTYNIADSLSTDSDRAITSWIKHQPYTDKEYKITSIVKDETITVPANYKIQMSTARRFGIGETFVISNGAALNFYAEIIDDTQSNDGEYYCRIDSDVEDYLADIKADWANVSGKSYKVTIKNPITILNGINSTDTGFRVRLYANQFIKIDYGTQSKVVALDDELNDNEWYGLVVNIGNTWDQYNVYVWEDNPGNPERKIKIKYYKTMSFTAEQTIIDNYTIDKSNAYISNIRLFNTTIEEENQSLELLSYFSKDADQALLLDNCEPRKTMPYVSQQK